MSRSVTLIGAPTDVGASDRGASMGPEALRVAGLGPALTQRGLDVVDRGNLAGPANPWQQPVDGYRHLREVIEWNRLVHDAVHGELGRGRLPILLGGDHCLGIGSISAVARHCRESGKSLRVLWLDAHADFNTSELSPSGNIHGMPLAVSLGIGHPVLLNIGGYTPKIKPENLVIIGARSLDDGEKELIKEKGIKVYTMHEIDRLGMTQVMKETIDYLSGTDGVHLSLDLDGLDPDDAPGVGTPVKGGISYRESHLAMEMLAEADMVTSAEFVEVNPILDQHNKTAEVAVALMSSLFGDKLL